MHNNKKLVLRNNVSKYRKERKLTQLELGKLVGVSRNTIGSIEREEYCPTARLSLLICIVLERYFEELFYFDIQD